MAKVLEKFQFSVCSFGQYRRTERLHYFLDSNRLTGELVFGRARNGIGQLIQRKRIMLPVCSHQTRPKAPIPTGWRSVYLRGCQRTAFATEQGCVNPLPAGDLEGGAEYLGTHELGHTG